MVGSLSYQIQRANTTEIITVEQLRVPVYHKVRESEIQCSKDLNLKDRPPHEIKWNKFCF